MHCISSFTLSLPVHDIIHFRMIFRLLVEAVIKYQSYASRPPLEHSLRVNLCSLRNAAPFAGIENVIYIKANCSFTAKNIFRHSEVGKIYSQGAALGIHFRRLIIAGNLYSPSLR